jgi:hypothetical protein
LIIATATDNLQLLKPETKMAMLTADADGAVTLLSFLPALPVVTAMHTTPRTSVTINELHFRDWLHDYTLKLYTHAAAAKQQQQL